MWVAGSAAGVAVLALPDAGPRVVSFSETHGPSAVDLAGMALLIGAWIPVAALIWSERASLHGRLGRRAALVGAVGAAALVLTIGHDLGASWVAAVILLLAAQAMALEAVASGADRPSGSRSPRRT
jgi:hypothetical protein